MKKLFWIITTALFVLAIAAGFYNLLINDDLYLIPKTIQGISIELAIALGVYVLAFLRRSDVNQDALRSLSFFLVVTFVIIYTAPTVTKGSSEEYVGFLLLISYCFISTSIGLFVPAAAAYLKGERKIVAQDDENRLKHSKNPLPPKFTRTKPPRYH